MTFPTGRLPALGSLAEATPHARLLSNGRFTSLLTGAGTGFAACDGVRLTGWSGDRVEDAEGLFLHLRDLDTRATWSLGQPPAGGRAAYRPGRVEVTRADDGIESTLEACVAPDAPAEVRRLRLHNASGRPRRLEVTTYAEVVLHDAAAHAAHPAFSKLFVQTAVDESLGVLCATRRPRGAGAPPPVLVHGLFGPGAAQWETDRVRFVGRGRSCAEPLALATSTPLSGTVGSVLDPIVSWRRTVRLDPGETARFVCVLGCAETVSGATALALRWAEPGAPTAALAGAATRAERVLADLGLSAAEGEYLHELAGAMLYGDPALRASREVVARVQGRLEEVGALGVAVGRPLLVTEVSAARAPERLDEVARALRYWQAHGLAVEALLVCDDVGGLAAGGVPGLRVVARSAVEARLLDVARAAACLMLRDAWPPCPRSETAVPGVAAAVAPSAAAPEHPRRDEALLFYNGYGGFTTDGRAYVIDVPGEAGERPPMPWTNVLANPDLGCVVSESGAGCTWSRNSREHRLTPWSNDPVSDPHGEALYVRDEDSGSFWSPQPGPAGAGGAYEARHGFGWTTWRHVRAGLESEVCTFVAVADPVRVTRVRLSNTSGRPRRLALLSYARLVLGVLPTDAPHAVITEHHPDTGMLSARSGLRGVSLDGAVFGAVVGAPNGTAVAGTCDRLAFIGRGGSPARPAALATPGPLAVRAGSGLDPCFVLQVLLEIPAGATIECAFLLGDAPSPAAARALVARYDAPGAAEQALAEVRESWDRLLGAVHVETPSPAVDLMVNGWLAYQTLACRLWGRTAFYQSGGAYGFRDQLQDAAALVWVRPDLTRAQLLLHAAHQFVEGDALHWWHPPDDRGMRTRFSDDLLWLPLLTAFYVQTTGDRGVLDEPVGFVTARALAPGEDEVFLSAQPAPGAADLYAHCCRAIDRSLALGAHGLPLMGTGDWNDGMNLVGRDGRGESVWMGFFLYTLLGDFVPLCEARGDGARVARYCAHGDALRVAVNDAGWDGAWYRRAYFDDGTPLGTVQAEECRIDVLPQAWAVISNAAPRARADAAMDAVERELLMDPPGLLRLLAPPFDRTPHEPGYIKGYVPGIRENGGQYTHAALWAVRALAELGRRNRAAAWLEMLTPVAHTRTAQDVATYQVEPYVVAADVYAVPPHRGRGGWTWYTGSSGWMLRVALESVLGFTVRDGRRLLLRPCVPDGWPGYALTYRLVDGRTRYEVTVENPDGCAAAVRAATLDGAAAAVRDGTAEIPLVADGAVHQVVVTLGAHVASPAASKR